MHDEYKRSAVRLWLLTASFGLLKAQSYLQAFQIGQTKYYSDVGCEGQRQQMNCSGTTVLHLQNAYFGRQQFGICTPWAVLPGACDHDVTRDICAIRKLCEGLQTCSFPVDLTVFQDSCPYVPKYVQVLYTCVVPLGPVVDPVCGITASPTVTSASVTMGTLNATSTAAANFSFISSLWPNLTTMASNLTFALYNSSSANQSLGWATTASTNGSVPTAATNQTAASATNQNATAPNAAAGNYSAISTVASSTIAASAATAAVPSSANSANATSSASSASSASSTSSASFASVPASGQPGISSTSSNSSGISGSAWTPAAQSGSASVTSTSSATTTGGTNATGTDGDYNAADTTYQYGAAQAASRLSPGIIVLIVFLAVVGLFLVIFIGLYVYTKRAHLKQTAKINNERATQN